GIREVANDGVRGLGQLTVGVFFAHDLGGGGASRLRETCEVLGPHFDGFGDVEGAHDGVPLGGQPAEGVEDDLGALRVDGDVPLGDGGRVAGVVEGAAHDDESFQESRQFGFDAEGEGEVGKGAGDEADD